MVNKALAARYVNMSQALNRHSLKYTSIISDHLDISEESGDKEDPEKSAMNSISFIKKTRNIE